MGLSNTDVVGAWMFIYQIVVFVIMHYIGNPQPQNIVRHEMLLLANHVAAPIF